MLRQLTVILSACLVFTACTKKAAEVDNSITFALKINLKGLDPANASDQPTNDVLGNVAESLLQYNYLKRPIQVEPSVAAAMPTVSKDGLTYTFKIREGVLFHDSEAFPGGKGRAVTAQDFIYSWKRLADPKVQSDGWWIFDGKIKGLNEWREKAGKGEANYDTPVAGLEAPDPQTLVIHMEVPYFQMLYVLTMTYTAAVPREAVEKYGAEFLNHPVGTGPFAFKSWIRGNKVVLTKNPNWHGTYPTEGAPGDKEAGLLNDAGKPIPFVDELVFLEIPEDQPRWLNFMKGNLDLAGIPKDSYDGVIANGALKPEYVAKGMNLEIYSNPEIVYTAFNMEDPILGKNVNLRRALCTAYDGKTAMEKFYNNRAVTAHSMIAPTMEGYDPDFKNPCKEFSVEKAKELLKKAGYPDGKGLPVLEFSDSGSSTGRQMAEYLQQQFAQIGVKVNIVSNSWPQFQDRIRNKKAQMWGMAWLADYPDPQNMMQLFYSKNISPGSNGSNFQNKEFDALYEKSLKLPPGAERTALYKKMRDIFVDQLPWFPTVHRQTYLVSQGWLHNIKPADLINNWFKYMRVDVAKKKELKAKL